MPQKPHPLTPGPAPTSPPTLDDIDRAIVSALLADARVSNAVLARTVGIAESTCLGRVRSLRERGVITGFRAVVDPAQVGRPIQAIIAIRLAGHDRAQVEAFGNEIAALPGVVSAFNISGADDFLVHVTSPSPDDLRDFVLDNVSSRPGVSNVQTSLVFRGHEGVGPLA
ncbi:Lrp/AsnC family transcriptional regulator [Knoellia subterranea]|uniref:AsnC family transcriptional regulator n=1 Tax=Knoellia subterranea KCTC 19937 TaxID=1385521 RepID=A0A0A0JPF1_9MICO|nr:Lrp/AsnC family transcriptional regulator [Knoellia subterranea]KGN39330.1 AsnC family transcriptional regulator [Knoellia subterranea KCTC 19937]